MGKIRTHIEQRGEMVGGGRSSAEVTRRAGGGGLRGQCWLVGCGIRIEMLDFHEQVIEVIVV